MIKQLSYCVALVAVSSWFGCEACGQDRSLDLSSDNWHFDFDLFQMLFEERGLELLSDIDEALQHPSETVIVICGPSRVAHSEGLLHFVRGGGALMVAFDNKNTKSSLGTFYWSQVVSHNPEIQYGEYNDCLQIPLPPRSGTTLRGAKHLFTNRSGWFVPNRELRWQVIARLPADCRPAKARRQPLLALGRPRGDVSGVALCSADASLFSNGMLWHGNNAIAAIRVSELLCNSNKTKVIFVANGMVQGSYKNRIGLPPATPPVDRALPRPGLETVLSLANAIAKEVADSNVLNEALQRQPRSVRRPMYFQAVLNTAAVLLLIGIVAALISYGSLKSVTIANPRIRTAVEMREDPSDYRDSAGLLSREFCIELTGSRQSAAWQAYATAAAVGSQVLDTAERQELTRIVDIACRGYQSSLTGHEFQGLGKSIAKLRAKLLDDRLTS